MDEDTCCNDGQKGHMLKVLFLTPPVPLPALKDSNQRSINSDWKIELPGEFQLAGTTVRYVRRGLWEKMSAKGPTKGPLHLMVNTSVSLLRMSGMIFMSRSLSSGEEPDGGALAPPEGILPTIMTGSLHNIPLITRLLTKSINHLKSFFYISFFSVIK